MFLINTIHKLDAAERFFQGRKEGTGDGEKPWNLQKKNH